MSIGLAKESIDCCAAFMGLNVLGSLGGVFRHQKGVPCSEWFVFV